MEVFLQKSGFAKVKSRCSSSVFTSPSVLLCNSSPLKVFRRCQIFTLEIFSMLQLYKGPENQYKYSRLDPGTSYQFRVKSVRVLSDARSIPGSWSPLAVYTLPLPSSSLLATTSKDSSLIVSEKRASSNSSKAFRQKLRQAVDFGDERVAIVVAGLCILVCVILISSYILMSN